MTALVETGDEVNPNQPSAPAHLSADQLPVACVTVDNRGAIRSHNRAFERLLGGEPGSGFVGRMLRGVMPAASQVAFDLTILPALRLGQAVSEAPLLVMVAGGADVPVLCYGSGGAVIGQYHLVIVPIATHHRVEHELATVRETVEQVPGAIFRLDESPGGRLRCSYFSGDAVVMLGVRRGCFHARLWQMMSREARRQFAAAMVEAARNYHVFQFDIPFHGAGAAPIRWLQIQARPQLLPSGARVWYGHIMDISPLKHGHLALSETLELMRATLDSISDAVIATDTGGRVRWFNPAAERIIGWSNAEGRGRPIEEVVQLIGEAGDAAQDNAVVACLREGAPRGATHRSLLVSRAGNLHRVDHTAAPIRSSTGEMLGAVLVLHDVSERRGLSDDAQHRVAHDALTGLINRKEFEQRLARLLRRVRSEPAEHALLYIDLDQFKLVNDACGHPAGDTLLRQVARLLTDSVRVRDTVARVGGDEFAIVLEHCNCAQAQHIGEHICERMDEFRFVHEERPFRLGASIGLVMIDEHWSDVARLIQAVDSACAAARESGRNHVHTWFDTEAAVRRHDNP